MDHWIPATDGRWHGNRLDGRCANENRRDLHDNGRMKLTYGGRAATGEAYEIEADRHGNYTIRLGAKVVKRVTSLTSYVGRPKWGSRKLEMVAIEEAKAVIDSGMVDQDSTMARTPGSSRFMGTESWTVKARE